MTKRMTKISTLGKLGVAILVLVSNLAWAELGAPSKLASDLRAMPSGRSVNVIVQYRELSTKQAAASAAMFARRGAPVRTLDLIRSLAMTVNSSSLQSLASDPNVLHVSLDHQVAEFSATTDFYDQAVNAPYGWSLGLDGSGIGVAIIDSGITDQGDFSGNGGSRVVYSENDNFDGVNNAFGHGTHVAGILAGNGTNSSGSQFTKTFKGIAPNANLLSFRVLDGVGVGTDSTVIVGIQSAINLKSTYNIKVMNISLGRPVFESYAVDPLCQAVEAAWKAGIVVVVAAGNDGRDNSFKTNGYETISAPGNDPYVITVGAMKPEGTATRTDDLIASYSSKGPTAVDHIVKPDLVAPGNLDDFDAGLDERGDLLAVPAGPGRDELLRDRWRQHVIFVLFHFERHEHGDAGGERRGGVAAAAKFQLDAGPDQGANDEDGVQDVPQVEHGYRPGDGDHVHGLLRHLHGGRGIFGYPGRTEEHGLGFIGGWFGAVASSRGQLEGFRVPGDGFIGHLGIVGGLGDLGGMGNFGDLGNGERTIDPVRVFGSLGDVHHYRI